jgi:hypothetical protein
MLGISMIFHERLPLKIFYEPISRQKVHLASAAALRSLARSGAGRGQRAAATIMLPAAQ